MACTKETVKHSGLNVWSSEAEGRPVPAIDIIAVQGLGADPFYTWVKKVPTKSVNASTRVRDKVQFWKAKKPQGEGEEDYLTEVMWPRDLLLPLFKDARIATYSYESDWRDPSVKTSLRQCAEQFLIILSQHRQHANECQRPIVLIGHSLGCLVIQQALVIAVLQKDFDNLRLSVAGIIFLGAPFQGSDAAFFGKWLARLSGRDSTLLKSLEKDNISLRHLSEDFWGSHSNCDLVCLYENIEAEFRLFEAKVVSSQSATLLGKRKIFLNTNHSGLNKFSGEDDENFALLLPEIRRMVERGPTIVADRHRIKDTSATNYGADFNVPFDLTGIPATSAFLGRKSDLDLMKEELKPGEESDRRMIYVIHGLGGIGKTQLAIEYARVHKAAYTSLFWLDGKTEDSLITGLVSIGARLPRGQISDIDVEDIQGLKNSKRAEEVLEWFARSGNTRWLLIYDNIDKTSYGEETTDQKSKSYDIKKYLPKGDKGSIIITTRLQRLRSLGNQVNLRPLNEEDSLSILEKHIGRSLKRIVPTDIPETNRWDPDAVSLVKRLGHLPLALVLAGSYISKTTIVEYRELYDKSWERLHSKMRRTDYPERTIITTWQISYDELKNKNEEAARLLQLWGYLDNQELWFELLLWSGYKESAPRWLQKLTANKFNFRETIDILSDYSLIENNENSKTYSIHLVLQDWIRESVNDKEGEEMLWTAITTVGLAVPRIDERDFATSQRRVLQHAVQILKYWSHISCFETYLDEACLASLNNLGTLYEDQGRMLEAEQMYQRALEWKEKTRGPEHTSTLDTVNNLGSLYRNQGRMAEAEQMFQRALEGKEKALGLEHTSTLNTVNNLGILYRNQGWMVEAEQMYQRALEGYEKALGPEHTSTLDIVNNLGILYKNQGRMVEAEQMYQRALEGYEKARGLEHTSTLDIVNNLGNLYVNQGRMVKAEQMYQRALEGYEKALGPEHKSTLNSVNNLGILYKNQGRIAEAEQMFQRALKSK